MWHYANIQKNKKTLDKKEKIIFNATWHIIKNEVMIYYRYNNRFNRIYAWKGGEYGLFAIP